MKFGSVCSGIEAASVAWEPLGWSADWLSEIEPFPAAVLNHHWPDIPNLGDMTTLPRRVLSGEISGPDILVGGTPCQAFSVAGMREGLNDERGQLTIKYVELLDAIDFIRRRAGRSEAIAVWENVPGVLSDRGNAFGCFLGALTGEDCELKPAGKKWTNAGCVYGPERAVAWRILDAQYFGVAQRRRRVFVVASARKDFDPAAVLFERDSMRRDSAPRRAPREEVTGTLSSRTKSGGGLGTDFECDGGLQVARMRGFGDYEIDDVSSTLKSRDAKGATDLVACVTGQRTHALTCEGFDASEDGTGRGTPIVIHGTQDPCVSSQAFTLGRNSGQENVVAFAENSRAELRLEGGTGSRAGTLTGGGGKAGQGVPTIAIQNATRGKSQNGLGVSESEIMYTLDTASQHGVGTPYAVRRLTPVECERLQDFPDNYTRISWRNKPADLCPDGPRYRALGNSMAVPVMRWIGERIAQTLSIIEST